MKFLRLNDDIIQDIVYNFNYNTNVYRVKIICPNPMEAVIFIDLFKELTEVKPIKRNHVASFIRDYASIDVQIVNEGDSFIGQRANLIICSDHYKLNYIHSIILPMLSSIPSYGFYYYDDYVLEGLKQ